MRVPARLSRTVAACALAGLTLTACGPGGDEASGGGPPSKENASSSGAAGSSSGGSSASKESSSGGSASGGSSAGSSAGSKEGGGAGGATAACTTKNTKMTFTASAHHASEQQAAVATVKVTNTSGTPCTIVGASALKAEDAQGKSEPISADNAGNGTDAVDLKPGATAQATVGYTDLNFEGSASAREVCAVQASKVEIALPKDVGRTVRVTKTDGSSGVFSVCRPEVRFSGFEN